VSLTWREQRALRAIERTLTEQDPALAVRLQGPPARSSQGKMLAWLGWSFLCLSIVLGVSGLVLSNDDLQVAAGLVLLSFPPLVLIVLTWVLRRPSESEGAEERDGERADGAEQG
jgi:hypothetical protein